MFGSFVHLFRAYGAGLGLLSRVRLLLFRPRGRLCLVVPAFALVGSGRGGLLRVGLLALALLLALHLRLLGALLPSLGTLVGGPVGGRAVRGSLLVLLLFLLLGPLPGGVARVLLFRALGGVLLLGGRVRTGPAAIAAGLGVTRRGVPLFLTCVGGPLVGRTTVGLLLLLPLDAFDAELFEEVDLGQRCFGGLEFNGAGMRLLGDLQELVVFRGEEPILQPLDDRVLQFVGDPSQLKPYAAGGVGRVAAQAAHHIARDPVHQGRRVDGLGAHPVGIHRRIPQPARTGLVLRDPGRGLLRGRAGEGLGRRLGLLLDGLLGEADRAPVPGRRAGRPGRGGSGRCAGVRGRGGAGPRWCRV